MSVAMGGTQSLRNKNWFIVAASMCLISVVMGAFAAHGLKAVLAEYQLSIVQTAAKYQMYHGLAILIVTSLAMQNGTFSDYITQSRLFIINVFFTVGICLFSGSLYALALTQSTYFAYMTPIGGVLFIAGWCSFILFMLRPVRS